MEISTRISKILRVSSILAALAILCSCGSFQRECTMDEWLVRTDCK